MSIQSLSALLAAIVTFVIGWSVVLRDRRRRPYVTFAVLCFNLGFWYLASFFHATLKASAIFWVSLIFAVAIPTSAERFFRAFLAEDPRHPEPISRPVVIGTWVFYTGLLYAGLFHPLHRMKLFTVPLFAFVFASLYRCVYLIWARKRAVATRSRPDATRLTYLFYGGAATVTLAAVDFLPRAGLTFPTIGNVLTIIYMYFISQTLFHFRLLDIKELLGKMVTLSALVLMLTVIYGLLLVWVGSDRPGVFFFNTVVASFVIMIIFEQLRTWVEDRINRWMFREKYEFSRRLDLLRVELANIIEAGTLCQRILSQLEESERVTHASIYLADPSGASYRLAGHIGPKPVEQIDGAARLFFLERIRESGILSLDYQERELAAQTADAQEEAAIATRNLLTVMEEMRAGVCIPLILENQILGLLNLRDDRLREAYATDELDHLRKVAAQAAITLGNSKVYEQMKERDRLAALGQMAAGLAHEIRNPLGAIKGAAQLLRSGSAPAEPPPGGESDEYMGIIVEEVNRLDRVLSQFLGYARPDRGERQELQVNDVVLKTMQLLSSQAGSATIVPELAPELPVVRGDPEQLRQVFLNLGINAFQAMEGAEGSTLRVVTRLRRSWKRGELTPFVEVAFHDTGKGCRSASGSSRTTAARSRCARSPARARSSPCSCPPPTASPRRGATRSEEEVNVPGRDRSTLCSFPSDNRKGRWLALVVGSALVLSAAACNGVLGPGGSARISELPIRRVVLYQNGVGYFEREGKLRGDELTLHCRPSQVNDLLKSLTVIDRGSGRALSVSLPLEKSGDKTLAELPKQVRAAAGLLDVLRVFRGAQVRLHGPQGSLEGRVLGVEQGLARAKEGAAPWSVTLKDRRGDLLVLPVHKIRRVELLDRTLAAGLDKSLDVSLEEGAWKSIALTVRLAGAERHDLLVSYIVEMPLWKPAYRLVLQKERPPLLQGWAVVDNVSGESWNDVRLSLVTGTPMSFVYDLHAPRFAARPDLTPGTVSAQAPPRETPADDAPGAKDRLQREYAPKRSARSESAPEPEPDATAERKRPPADARRRGPSAGDASALNVMLEKQLEQVKTAVKGEKLGGSLFRYDLRDPVTIPDSSSTLVNIVNGRVPGEEVVLFRPELTSGQAASHPYRAVKFKNDSGFALEAGPVALYAQGTFVGEGFLERMEKGQTLFLTYAIDGNVTMTQTQSYGEEALRLLKIHRGMIESEVLRIARGVFTVTNNHDSTLVAYVKSARPSAEHKLRDAPKGTVETPEASYLPVSIPARARRELKVEWIAPVRRWIAVDTSLAGSVLRLFLGKGEVPASVKPTLEKVLVAKEKLDKVEAELARIRNLKGELEEDQHRVRANLDLLRKVKGNDALKTKLTRNLASLEDQLSKQTALYVKLDEEKAALQAEMRTLIGQISFESGAK